MKRIMEVFRKAGWGHTVMIVLRQGEGQGVELLLQMDALGIIKLGRGSKEFLLGQTTVFGTVDERSVYFTKADPFEIFARRLKSAIEDIQTSG